MGKWWYVGNKPVHESRLSGKRKLDHKFVVFVLRVESVQRHLLYPG